MNSDNTMQKTSDVKQHSIKDHNYLAPPPPTKQIINFKAQSQYQSVDLVEDDDEGEYEL